MAELTEEQQDDLKFMQDTPGWPLWPCLPLKRYQGEALTLEVGVLWAMDFDGLYYLWFPGVHMWDPKQMMSLSNETGIEIARNDLSKLIEEGWKVD